ncbi:MAG: hypothetical protein A2285_08825 [Elusimicrobia bacterium RIFOXYA12_FULL_57_11]|nr:MAG: hypothetical protein A2285_08825 [Elusimicrobia bacterium RIFOXYA12_FULL_57_11]
MKNKFTLFAAFVVLGPAAPLFAAPAALSQLPAAGQVTEIPPAPVMKADSLRLDFRVNQQSRSGFYLNDLSGDMQVNGYKDFDGNMRFSAMAGQESLFGRLERNYNAQDFTFEMGATVLQVRRYTNLYKVTGFAAGANGAAFPVNLVIRGGIRGGRYSVSEAGLELSASGDAITGALDARVYDKKFALMAVSIIASLQSDEIFCVVEKASNFPNPFLQGNGTTLTYTLLQPADYVKLTIYNAYGKVLAEMDGAGAKGENRVFWDGRSSYNDSFMGRKTLVWQLELVFRGEKEKIMKQFTMEAR